MALRLDQLDRYERRLGTVVVAQEDEDFFADLGDTLSPGEILAGAGSDSAKLRRRARMSLLGVATPVT